MNSSSSERLLTRQHIIAIVAFIGVIAWYFFFVPRYGKKLDLSLLTWLKSTWSKENDMEHGMMIPLVVFGLIFYRAKDIRDRISKGSIWGLAVALFGVLLYLAAYRTLQARLAAGAIPFIFWGAAWYWFGWRSAKTAAFPLAFFWLCIPLTSFQQATVYLQIIATKLSAIVSSLFGVETIIQGTAVRPANGQWEALEIAGGCSGVRSLMALIMISATWAYIAKISLWKRCLLFFMAFPLAVIGNALRVASIFVISEYGSAEWARGTWHDWSGLLLFYPISLITLLFTHSILEGGLPWKKPKRRVVAREVSAP